MEEAIYIKALRKWKPGVLLSHRGRKALWVEGRNALRIMWQVYVEVHGEEVDDFKVLYFLHTRVTVVPYCIKCRTFRT